MNYSAVVIPVTKAAKDLDPFDDSYEPLNEVDELNWKSCKHSSLLLVTTPLSLSAWRAKMHLQTTQMSMMEDP